MQRLKTDVLILGSGGAGLFAALHAHQRDPGLKITIAVKGLLGKCGCTRMVQGGYNVALIDGDSSCLHDRLSDDAPPASDELCGAQRASELRRIMLEELSPREREVLEARLLPGWRACQWRLRRWPLPCP